MPHLGVITPPTVRVVGFAPTIQVYQSKQKPVRLTMYGDDLR